ncbi:MAG TPA: hypothetical protein VMP01_27115 [Pirellulaceae bacterium]|nr:hypothetical protein [Pirellulaceae bacterium]
MTVLICIADHFEPLRGGATITTARERVARWVRGYPELALPFADSRGRPPQHTFFYPAEEYQPELLDTLAGLCQQGLGDVEVHLHHDHDTASALCEKLLTFTAALNDQHGLLARDEADRVTYGFIHGNWALDNSRPDGRWCGVNEEISVLLQTGCYADFTMPSAPAPCQTRTINSIYYAHDDPARPKSHDVGIPARVGARRPDDSLLMIQGPLALDFSRRKHGFLPTIDNGELTGIRPPTLSRLWNWLGARVCVLGQPDLRFVKLHTHGAWEANTSMLLGEPMRAFHAALRAHANIHDGFRYYYVTARELAAVVDALEKFPMAASRFDEYWRTAATLRQGSFDPFTVPGGADCTPIARR